MTTEMILHDAYYAVLLVVALLAWVIYYGRRDDN